MSRTETFNSFLARVFPDEHIDITKIAGNHVYNITFQVTNQCNLACSYCYQHNKNCERMSFDTAKKFIDMILAGDERSTLYINSYKAAGVVFEFIGGEPFLEIDLINNITEYILSELIRLNHPWANRVKFSMTSNGTLYFDPRVQEYLSKYKNFISLTITLDGDKELHDSCRKFPDGTNTYDIVHKAAEDWRKKSKLEQTKITISPENVNGISKALIYLIQQENYKVIFINCVYEEGWNSISALSLYRELKIVVDFLIDNGLQDDIYITILNDPCGASQEYNNTPWCGGSGLMINVDPRGDIYPCVRYSPSSIGEEKAKKVKIGDVEHGFIYTEQQRKLLEEFSKVTRETQLACHERCIDCPIREGCGDCAAYSYEVSGKIGYRTNFHCVTHVVRVLINEYFTNKTYILTKKGTPVHDAVPKEWALEIIPLKEYELLKQTEKEAFYELAK